MEVCLIKTKDCESFLPMKDNIKAQVFPRELEKQFYSIYLSKSKQNKGKGTGPNLFGEGIVGALHHRWPNNRSRCADEFLPSQISFSGSVHSPHFRTTAIK